MSKDNELSDEFRMILSHAFLGCDTSDISKETWDLAISECVKFTQTLSTPTACATIAEEYAREMSVGFIMWNHSNYQPIEASNYQGLYENKIEFDGHFYTTTELYSLFLKSLNG